MNAQDVAVIGLIGGLILLSTFDVTSKFALYLALLLAAIAAISVWQRFSQKGPTP